MEFSASSDSELLTAWVNNRSEPTFRALVERYAGLVHRSAYRTCCDENLAAEAAQMVFMLLTRRAPSLTGRASLAGWLHTSALLQAKNLLRQSRRETRKRQQLHSAMEQNNNSIATATWQDIAPGLDHALASLSDADRETLLLRFYRCLSIREIAATFGIATDAAQKRLDRATARLRQRLARRGCDPANSLGGLLLAGFADDVQSTTLRLPAITSKILAAIPPATGAPPPVGAEWTAMKIAAFASPLLALAVSASWLGLQQNTITNLQDWITLLEKTNPQSAPPPLFPSLDLADVTDRTSPKEQGWTDPDIKWQKICAHIALKKSSLDDPGGAAQWFLFNQKLPQMTKEELMRALDEVTAIGNSLPRAEKFEVMFRIADVLLEKLGNLDPLSVLEAYASRLSEVREYSVYNNQLPLALERLAGRDWKAAAAWLDQQTASGRFNSKSLDGISKPRVSFEAALLKTHIQSGSELQYQRLAQLAEAPRMEVLKNVAFGLDSSYHLSFANMVRAISAPESEPAVLAGSVARKLTLNGFTEVDEFMNRINATDGERLACVGESAFQESFRLLKAEDDRAAKLDSIHQWITTHYPANAAEILGRNLGRLAVMDDGGALQKAAELALEYGTTKQGDAVLQTFVESPEVRPHRHQLVPLAASIKDPTQRAGFIRKLAD